MTIQKVKLSYRGSVGWLVFWLIVFFPVGVVLLLTGGQFQLDRKTYSINYDGSRNWLCFWAALLYPVAVLLVLLNGFSLVMTDDELTPAGTSL